MQKLFRPEIPQWYKSCFEMIKNEYVKDLSKKIYLTFDENLTKMLVEDLSKMSNNHCFFCDDKIISSPKVNYFLSKKSSSYMAFEWGNLYLSCPFCNNKKANNFDIGLLRPDAEDYDFDRYFQIDFKTGELNPNFDATKEEQQRAKITIDTFGLNAYERPQARLKELFIAQQTNPKTFTINDFSYRFFVERGLKLLNEVTFSSIKIDSITIKNIRCFGELAINFDETCNLMVGTNSRGKTTILQLIAIGLLNIDYIPFINAWFDVVRKEEEVGYITLNITYKTESIRLEYEINQENRIRLLSDKSVFDKIKNVLVLGYGSNRYIKYQEEKPNNTKLQAVATLFGENDYLKHIRRLNTYLQVEIHFESIKDLINEIFSKADKSNQVRLERFGSEYKAEKLITFYFSTPTNPKELIPLESLSDGFKATFVWLFDMTIRIVENLGNIYNRKEIGGVILIDEIDLHIHPRWQRTLLPTLCELFPKIQFIVTTHSDLVAQSVKANHIKKLYLNEKDSSVLVTDVKFGQGSSSNFIYDDVFGIKERFDVETEKELKQFMTLRNKVLEQKMGINDKKVKQIVSKLIAKSKQVEMIVSQELNQMQRITGEVFEL